MTELIEKHKGPLAWFAKNHVAANLLMFLILAGGIISILTIKVEIFPEMTVDVVTVSVPYLGASPAEVEEGVCRRVEEAVSGIDGIKRLKSTSSEGMGTVVIEVEEYADSRKVLDDVKAEVDRITTFPAETEKPIITEITTKYHVLSVVIFGDATERTLKNLAEQMRDDLTAMDNISQVAVSGARRYEISIEVSEETLRRHGLSFSDVADAIGRSSLDLPGGSVKTQGGEILIRTKGQRYVGEEFEKIVVLTNNDGTKITLDQIARINDGFEDSDVLSRFDGSPSVMLQISRVGEQGVLDISRTAKAYIEQKRQTLPDGVNIATWFDRSIMLQSRMDLLRKNAMIGLSLVFLSLALFLDLKLAFWTTMGIPISFLGAFWLMPMFDVSINMISLFAFILSLGIVVDDAIVVGENIFAYRQKGHGRIEAAILGVKEMTWPVIMAVVTTIFAFMPLLYIAGVMGKFIRVIPIVVICVLAFSLVEALCILPAHLSGNHAGKKRDTGLGGLIGRGVKILLWPLTYVQEHLRGALDKFINGPFLRFVDIAVAWRYVTLSIAIAVLLTTVGYARSGRLKFAMFPKVDADNVWATLRMPQGTSVEQTKLVVQQLEAAAERVRAELDADLPPDSPSMFRHIATDIGNQPFTRDSGVGPPNETGSGSHLAEVNIELLEGENRQITSTEIANKWRNEVGEIAGISSLTYTSTLMHTGDAVNIEMSHRNFDVLLEAVDRLKVLLADFDGVIDIDDSFEPGKLELKLAITDQGRTLGLTLEDLARQVRQGFYGYEVQRVQRGRDDIRVMVRYPVDERTSLADIENMRLRLKDGTEIPFNVVAQVEMGRGYAAIMRADRRRVVNVTADVDADVANANEINFALAQDVLPQLKADFSGLACNFEGEQREQKETGQSLGIGVIFALLAIFGVLAIQFRSYVQPLIIMSAIPFGLVGAIVGHIIMGYGLSMLSLFGIVALAGVVVNDSLIMVDLINRERAEGIELHQVIIDSATRRFRPILLTTLTTFIGLMPMIFERALQARFLIPMAISLAFGIVFATSITLLLVPSLYMILEDVKAAFVFVIFGQETENNKG